MTSLRAAILATVAACHASAPPASPQQATGPTCAQVADALMATLPKDAGELATQLHDMVARRCTQDAWTEDARRCVTDAKSHGAAAACQSKLTPEQQQALSRDGDEVMDKYGVKRKTDEESTAPVLSPAAPDTGAAPPPPGAPPAAQPAPEKPRSLPKPDSDPCAGGQ